MFAFRSCCALQAVNPQQFIECYIAEQNLVGVAIGCASRNRAVAFASTFACFLSRAYDQLRMGAISQTNANFCGSHCGVSIGEHPSSVYVCYRMVQRTGPQRHLDQFSCFCRICNRDQQTHMHRPRNSDFSSRLHSNNGT